jgi:hypothetical protein
MGGLFAVLQTDRPLGAVAQFARFKVKSEGYLPSAGHFGTILNIGLDFDPSAAIGRGLIVGNVSGRPDGCQTAPPKSQFQLWWHNTEDPPVPDSHLAPKSCSSFTWQDNTWYEVELYVDSSRDLYYSVSDQAGTKLYSSAIRENRTPGMTDDSGFGFFATDQNAPVSGEQWRLSFLDIKIGWSDELLY